MKKNCWEFKNCGRQSGGAKVTEFGVCPATKDLAQNGKNNGQNAGRYCWKIAGTFCDGKVQGSFATKMENCFTCDFLKQVQKDEGRNFKA